MVYNSSKHVIMKMSVNIPERLPSRELFVVKDHRNSSNPRDCVFTFLIFYLICSSFSSIASLFATDEKIRDSTNCAPPLSQSAQPGLLQ